jgi:hypothetical protein
MQLFDNKNMLNKGIFIWMNALVHKYHQIIPKIQKNKQGGANPSYYTHVAARKAAIRRQEWDEKGLVAR